MIDFSIMERSLADDKRRTQRIYESLWTEELDKIKYVKDKKK